MKPTSEKLNIAMLGHKRIPSNEGGVEVVVEALCARMAALGHSVTCYNRAGHHVSGAEYELAAGSVYRGSASAEGYCLDGTPLKLSQKDQLLPVLGKH